MGNKVEEFYPSQSQLDLINERKISLTHVEKTDGIALKVHAADMEIDRGSDKFSQKALETMASLAIQNKIPYFLANENDSADHNWKSINNRGNVFNAYVENGVLYYDIYFPFTESNKSFIEDVVNGLHNKVSVGFAIKPEEYLCSSCQVSLLSEDCPHIPGQGGIHADIADVSDNFELSGAGVPMQVNAHVVGKGVTMSEEETKVVENTAETEVKSEVEVELKPTDLLAAVKSFSTQLSSIEESVVSKMTAALLDAKKSCDDKISNDTIQDNSLMSEQVETKSEETAAAEQVVVKEASEDMDGDRHAALMSCMKDAHDKIDSAHAKMDALHSKLNELHTKMEAILGTEQKSVDQEVAEVKEQQVEETKAVQEAPAAKEVESTRSTKSLEERVNEQVLNVQKTADELLWERLTLKQ